VTSKTPGPLSSGQTRPTASSLKRKAKNLFKRELRRLFETGQRFGLDILPRHYYSEIPCIRELLEDATWKLPRSMHGVHGADPLSQFEFMESCCCERAVTRLAENDIHARACADNGEPGFGLVDADFLYAFIQAHLPPKIVQMGCGVSTAVMLLAAGEAGFRPEIVCIEPYPTPFLRKADRSGEIRLVEQKAQAVPLATITDLGHGGLLFVDSTHTVKPGSEVNRLILEVLPRIAPGSWAHFHDIYFPYDYQRGLLDDELFFSNETALLHAFLINNPSFTIRASLSMLHHADPGRLARSLPNYAAAQNDYGLRVSQGDFPASIYLQAVEQAPPI
jgi:hypothetical protein